MTYDPTQDGEIYPNAGFGAAIAGGALSGLGQGFGQIAQNQFISGEKAKDRDFLQQLYKLQFQNSLKFATYQQELAGYRTPGAVAGVNRAGQSSGSIPSQYPGLGTKRGYSPQTTGTGKLSAASQTDPQGFPWQAKTGHTRTFGETMGGTQTVGTQTPSNVMRSIGSQTNRPPGNPSGSLPQNSIPRTSRVNPNLGGLRPQKLEGVTTSESLI